MQSLGKGPWRMSSSGLGRRCVCWGEHANLTMGVDIRFLSLTDVGCVELPSSGREGGISAVGGRPGFDEAASGVVLHFRL